MGTLFLDDDQSRIATFLDDCPEASQTARTAAECIYIIDQAPTFWETISLDATLVTGGSGMDVVEHIIQNYTPQTLPAKLVVHSCNKANGMIMVTALVSAGFAAEYIPFVWDTPAHRARYLAKSGMTQEQFEAFKANAIAAAIASNEH